MVVGEREKRIERPEFGILVVARVGEESAHATYSLCSLKEVKLREFVIGPDWSVASKLSERLPVAVNAS